MKDLRPLHFFLGIHVQRTESGFFLHQAKYVEDILNQAGMLMLNCKPSPTLVDTNPKSLATEGGPATDASFYHSIVGALQYLILTRLNLVYVVHQVCLHTHYPRNTHWALVKRILRYIHGTTTHGMHIIGSNNL
jgi:hypothetical protein